MPFSNLDAELINAFGESATYTPSGGSPVTLYMLIEKDVQEVSDGYISERQNHGLIADRTIAPKAGDTIAVGASTYTVGGLVSDDGYLMRLLLT